MAAQPTPSQPEHPLPTKDSPLPDPIITTSRLLIRPMHPRDAPTMTELAAPASITKYMSLAFAHPYTLAHAETWIAMNLPAPQNHFLICERSNPDVMIGSIGIKPGSDVQSHTAEIGYWVSEALWGKGIISEALEVFTEWAFTKRGEIKRIWAGVFSGNTASMKCLEKCGYEAEGIMKGHTEKYGVTMDVHIFGLTKIDWEKKREERAQ